MQKSTTKSQHASARPVLPTVDFNIVSGLIVALDSVQKYKSTELLLSAPCSMVVKHGCSIADTLKNLNNSTSVAYARSATSLGETKYPTRPSWNAAKSLALKLWSPALSSVGWSGHVSRMQDSRILKALMFGELSPGKRSQG